MYIIKHIYIYYKSGSETKGEVPCVYDLLFTTKEHLPGVRHLG